MRDRKNRTQHLAILAVGFASLMGWINPLGPSGKDVYAQYGCTLSCTASSPGSGTVGNAVSFSSSVSSTYCTGEPRYSWNFGDGSTSSSGNPSHTYQRAGTFSWSLTVNVDDASASRNGTITITGATNTLTGVSAASFRGGTLASEQIVASFGTGLATATEVAATLPLPTSLAGTTVKVKDSAGLERTSQLFFVSPGQINFLLPPGIASGAARLTVTSGDGTISAGDVRIANVAPGLFSANANGQGAATGYALRVKADNSQSAEPITQFDTAQNRFVPVPIDLGPATDQVVIVLFGTGIRLRSSLSAASVSIGGTDAQLLFAGPQGDFVGLDQVNVLLPRSLIGRGEVDIVLTVDGQAANTLRLNVK